MRRILVAMSGGVDSAAAAVMLLEQGYEVGGATMKLFDNSRLGLGEESTCCSLADIEDARAAAHRLGIEHYVLNMSEVFHSRVMERFAQGYRRGETPNPCVDCNRYVKIPLLLERARMLGYDGIATGHYARAERGEGRMLLKRGTDTGKDQSYVLYAMTQDELAHTLFPLGGVSKGAVRALAVRAGLSVAEKADSQDICFVRDGDYAGFLTEVMKIRPVPGPITDTRGKVLGTHPGLIHYTIGQRKGLPGCFGAKRYVVAKEAATETLVIGGDEEVYAGGLTVGSCNWVSVAGLTAPMKVTVKTRYRQRDAAAIISPDGEGGVRVVFEQAQRAVTPGQAAVFYQGETVIGGGTILL